MPKTPGVYIEELSLLPPSVVEVSTAIPAFVGYTQNGADLGPTRINSLPEYEELFGGPYPTTISGTETILINLGSDLYQLYYQLSMFFRNGGGACYIVSAGSYKNSTPWIDPAELQSGINKLNGEDEPTLLVVPEAPITIYSDILKHCKESKYRFAVLDAQYPLEENLETAIGTVGLDYGAVYTPYLITDLIVSETHALVDNGTTKTPLSTLKGTQSSTYSAIKAALAKKRIVLPPSGAIAGVYARVDRERGVWKAPANVSLVGVLAPEVKISHDQQEPLNEPDSGKSINAIRSFTGKGVLVWGARTLMGSDNEWKYVNVRRLFITIEESIQKATQFAVFEPNTASTWLKVKAMIESYLYSLWQRGALAGTKPEQAYFVRVGLNVTMNQNDILTGNMRVSVGIAAVRPAEFITITFSHKLQEA